MRFSRSALVPLTIMIPKLMATDKANKPLYKVHNHCHDQQLDFVSCFHHCHSVWRFIAIIRRLRSISSSYFFCQRYDGPVNETKYSLCWRLQNIPRKPFLLLQFPTVFHRLTRWIDRSTDQILESRRQREGEREKIFPSSNFYWIFFVIATIVIVWLTERRSKPAANMLVENKKNDEGEKIPFTLFLSLSLSARARSLAACRLPLLVVYLGVRAHNGIPSSRLCFYFSSRMDWDARRCTRP